MNQTQQRERTLNHSALWLLENWHSLKQDVWNVIDLWINSILSSASGHWLGYIWLSVYQVPNFGDVGPYIQGLRAAMTPFTAQGSECSRWIYPMYTHSWSSSLCQCPFFFLLQCTSDLYVYLIILNWIDWTRTVRNLKVYTEH